MMASQTQSRSTRSRGGFTLIELLVVIGIIVLLLALATPMVLNAWRSGVRTKLASDFGTISMALEEYKKDFGDYPRVDSPNTGFAVLGKALIGTYGDGFQPGTPPTPDSNDPPTYTGAAAKPGDCVQTGANSKYVALVENAGAAVSDVTTWAPFTPNDLEDGFGSRLRVGGKKAGPYLNPEKFRVRGCALLDANDKPILYFPAKTSKPNLSTSLPGGGKPFIDMTGYGQTAVGVNRETSLYNANDNLQFFKRFDDTDDTRAMGRFAAMLGDVNNNGLIDPGEQAASTGPFLLWAAGPDGFYGPITQPTTTPPTPLQISKCDDVINARQ